jgi:hypothetical protein
MPNIEDIIRYENGEMTEDEVIELFRDGVQRGWVWKLQGSYGRMAMALIDSGRIWPSGRLAQETVGE